MLKNQRLFYLMSFGLFFIFATPTLAQNNKNNQDRYLNIPRRVSFKPPSNQKKPKGNTEVGGSRGGCDQDTIPRDVTNFSSTQSYLIPLVPKSNFGETIAQQPTLSIYLSVATSARQLVLSIREEDRTHHSQTLIPITGEPGIITLQMNRESPPLEIGKTYQWSVVLVCGEKPSPNDPGVASWVRRIAQPQGINQGSNLEQAAWYREQGIWYDALTSLIELRRSQPQNQELIDIWNEFLSSEDIKVMTIKE